MMTIAELIDRLFRTYLEPPDFRPVELQLSGPLTADVNDNILTVAGFLVPEDQDLLSIGTIIEVDRELMQVLSYDLATLQVGVARAFLSTPLTSYGVGTVIGKLAPMYPRQSVFESVADNIIQLYPKLYSVNTSNLVTVHHNIAGMEDELAVEVIEVWRDGASDDVDFDARMVDFHPSVGGRAVITNILSGGIWIRYRRRFGKPTDETATLASLGVDERWVNILMAGAAADLMAGRDVPASSTEWVQNTLQAESIQIGQRSGIAVSLARYRELLITRAESEMSAEYRPVVHMRSPWKQVVR